MTALPVAIHGRLIGGVVLRAWGDLAGVRRHIIVSCLLSFSPMGAGAGAQSWTTVPEFAIGGASGSETALAFVSSVRVGPNGKIYVVESRGAARRVTVWEPPGIMTLELGPSSEARAYGSLIGVRPGSNGFWVTYRSHLVHYDEDGTVLETAGRPPFLAFGRRPTNVGVSDGEAVWERPLLRVRQRQDEWIRDTIAILDAEHTVLAVMLDDGSGLVPNVFYTGQPFADNDFPYFAADGGRVGIVVRNGAPGEVQLTEISTSADTVWTRRISLPPQRLSPEQHRTTLDGITRSVLDGWDPSRYESEETLRSRTEEALYSPDYLPSITAAVSTGSGELWLRSSETSDTLVAWYTFARGDPNSTLRRVLLPTWFRTRDATATHVWGTRMNSSGAAQVLGRRLAVPR